MSSLAAAAAEASSTARETSNFLAELDNTIESWEEHLAEGQSIVSDVGEVENEAEMGSETAHLKRSQQQMEETDFNLKKAAKRF